MACAAAIATAVGAGACGTSVPSGDLAVVGNAKVKQAQFDHWMTVANNQPYVGTGYAPPAVPVPPHYTACIASERKRDPSATRNTWRKDCVATYKQLSQEVVSLLIEGIWFQGEANDRHVKVSQNAIDKAWSTERKAQFTTKKKLDDFLSESGYTVADLKWVAMLDLLQQAIVKKVDAKAGKVSAKQVAAYYHHHIAEYKQPERRDVELVLVSSAATEAKVRSLLAGGASWSSTAKKYSIDPTTKSTGGVLDGVEKGEETAIFDKALFKAPIGTLSSTPKTPFGYYVFKVTSSTPASTESFKTAKTAIKLQLVEQRQSAAVNALRTNFVKKWKARTTCASGYIVAQLCGNAPSSSTGASGATGATGSS